MEKQVAGTKSPRFIYRKMISETKVRELVEAKIKDSEIFLVEIKVGGGNRINIAIDRPGKLNVGDCAEVSRYVEAGLNRDVEDFELTVSSPGLDQPLKVLNQFLKHTGRNVRVLLKDGKLLRGKMTKADEEALTIELFTENKKKKIKS